MKTDQQIEQEIQAKGLTAPRVTREDIERNIASEHYFTALDGVDGYYRGGPEAQACPNARELGLLTFCVLVLRNGFTVTGESACASPENFDAQIGRDIARNNAVSKVWQLEGYLLKQNLSNTAPEPIEPAPLEVGDTVISVEGAMSVGVTGIVEIIRSEMSVGVRTPTGDLWHEQASHWKKIA